MYNEKVLKIFEESKNAGMIKGASGVGKVGNVKCGDIMKIYILIENGKIKDAKFKTFGCVSAIASSDVACDMIKGKTVEDALKVTNRDVLEFLHGLPSAKVHCSVLAQEAIAAAITDYKKKNGLYVPPPKPEKSAKAPRTSSSRVPGARLSPTPKFKPEPRTPLTPIHEETTVITQGPETITKTSTRFSATAIHIKSTSSRTDETSDK